MLILGKYFSNNFVSSPSTFSLLQNEVITDYQKKIWKHAQLEVSLQFLERYR